MRTLRRLACVLLLLSLSFLAVGAAEPLPACALNGSANPEIEASSPTIRLWHAAEISRWAPPPCLDWAPKPASVLVETTGRIDQEGSADALLARFGVLSAMQTVKYWSVTRRAWKPLFERLEPLTGESREPREDFTHDELHAGGALVIRQREAHLPGEVILELRVTDATSDRIEIRMENVEPVRWLGATVIEPRDYEFYYLLARDEGATWRYYSLARLTGGGPALALLGDKSYINRAAAIFRYVAGIPTDAEPPAAP